MKSKTPTTLYASIAQTSDCAACVTIANMGIQSPMYRLAAEMMDAAHLANFLVYIGVDTLRGNGCIVVEGNDHDVPTMIALFRPLCDAFNAIKHHSV